MIKRTESRKCNRRIKIMKYKCKIVETLSKVVEVEAEDYDAAFKKVEKMVNCEEVVLTADDFEGREIYPYENENQ